jgi:hypothetical protein
LLLLFEIGLNALARATKSMSCAATRLIIAGFELYPRKQRRGIDKWTPVRGRVLQYDLTSVTEMRRST